MNDKKLPDGWTRANAHDVDTRVWCVEHEQWWVMCGHRLTGRHPEQFCRMTMIVRPDSPQRPHAEAMTPHECERETMNRPVWPVTTEDLRGTRVASLTSLVGEL